MADEQAASIPLTPVDSSQIEAVGYEPGKLWVKFKRGGTYVYKDVPLGVFQELLTADSKGKFLKDSVQGRFDYERVE